MTQDCLYPLSDAERLMAGFTDCTLPKSEWTHEAHLIAGLHLLAKFGENALSEMRRRLLHFNESVGGVNDDHNGYHETMTVLKSIIMKKLLLIGGLLVVIGAAVGFYLYNKPHQNMRSAKADFQLTAAQLFSDYQADEAAANTKYLGKIIEVTGVVQEVKKEDEGKIGVTLEGGDMMFGVICKLDDFSEAKRTEFTVGEQVTFKGECSGMLMDVVLVRCVEM